MSRSAPRSRNALRIPQFLAGLIAVTALVIGTAAPVAAASASASQGVTADLSATIGGVVDAGVVKTTLAGFTPGNIISDAVFTNPNTMTEAQIQAFFTSKVKTCQSGYVCLKDFRITSVNRPADSYCKGYTGAANETAARIIYRVAQSCRINPQVLIVMLQKEQGLVTHTWPSARRYNAALGQGCPDGGVPCDPKFVGFFHQIYGAARQMQLYMEGRYFTWYAPGKTWNLLYHPNRACGTSPVRIVNKATSALYYYTPYQPNAAALRAGYGTGDSCSSYGNRNFYNYFTDWFGSTSYAQFTVGAVKLEGIFAPGQTVIATAQFTPAPSTSSYQWYRNGAAIAGATQQSYKIGVADGGTQLDVVVSASRSGYQGASLRSTANAVKSMTVERIYGGTREETSVAVSRAAWPSGTRTVFVATSMEFADALSSAAAAGKAQASLLLTPSSALPAAVAAELKRLAPTRIVLMGGEGVFTPRLAQSIAATVPGAKIERVAGPNRYATSRAMVEWAGASTNLLISSGRGFPDALSAASVGGNTGSPVMLVDGLAPALDAESIATIRKIGATNVTIVGGTGVVNERIAADLAKLGVTVTRLAGADRYLTNAAVNNHYFPSTALRTLVAAGTDFPDALSASALAGRWKLPLFLSEPTCIPASSSEFMRTRGTESVVLIGGPGVLTPDGVGQLRRCG